jgi:hypothetical protein
VAKAADALFADGLLARDFFERFHLCSGCNSPRLHVREECPHCHSSHLSERQYIHHFRCAFQGSEDKFRRGRKLICPKCERELCHFGYDYDRPGTMLSCENCGHASADPSVGFVCLDCGTHTNADIAASTDMFSYRLTDAGIAFALNGSAALGPAQRLVRFADLPLEMAVAINAAARTYQAERRDFCVAQIFYRSEREIVDVQGSRHFSQVRDLFLEALRNELDESATVVKGHWSDFAALVGSGVSETQRLLDNAQARASLKLSADLGVDFKLFAPQDLL